MTATRLKIKHPRLFTGGRLAGFAEVALVAALFILASWYWPVSEHIVYLIAFSLMVLLWIERKTVVSARVGFRLPTVFLLLFLAWLAVSVAWSGAIHQSLVYAVLVVLFGLTAVMLGIVMSFDRILQGIVAGMLFLLAHGLVTSQDDGFPLGQFSNPSELSMPLGVALLAAVFLWRSSAARNVLVGILTVCLGWATWSVDILTTVVAVAGALLAAVPIWHARRVRSGLRWPVILGYLGAAVAAIVIFWTNRSPLLELIGEDETMSGRTILWDWYGEAFMWRPLLGAGWGNSVGWPPLERDRVQQVTEFFPAHNGFIDTGLMLGGIGLLLLLGVLGSQFAGGLSALLFDGVSFRYAFVPMLVAYLILNDLMATSLPKFIGILLMGLMAGVILTEFSDLKEPETRKRKARSAIQPL